MIHPFPTRRQCCALIIDLFARDRAGAAGSDGRTLRQAAAAARLSYGAAATARHLMAEDDFRAAVLRECDWLTPEIELKWAAVEPVAGAYSFDEMDALAALARGNGKTLRGHNLLWHRSIPPWAEDALRRTRDWGLIERHFTSVIPRYGDLIDQWDVINEPMEMGRRMDGLRGGVLLDAFGPDYIRRALETARRLAPRGTLMINEFGLDYDTPEERDRRYLFLKLLESLKKQGAPLDGVGLQAHLDLAKGPFSASVLKRFLDEIAGMGLSITVTELDVLEANRALPVAQRDRRVADAVRRYLDVVLAHPAVLGVCTWGLSDRHSWLAQTDGSQIRERRNRGLPLDRAMAPKPLHAAMIAAFDRAARRR